MQKYPTQKGHGIQPTKMSLVRTKMSIQYSTYNPTQHTAETLVITRKASSRRLDALQVMSKSYLGCISSYVYIYKGKNNSSHQKRIISIYNIACFLPSSLRSFPPSFLSLFISYDILSYCVVRYRQGDKIGKYKGQKTVYLPYGYHLPIVHWSNPVQDPLFCSSRLAMCLQNLAWPVLSGQEKDVKSGLPSKTLPSPPSGIANGVHGDLLYPSLSCWVPAEFSEPFSQFVQVCTPRSKNIHISWMRIDNGLHSRNILSVTTLHPSGGDFHRYKRGSGFGSRVPSQSM